MAEADAGARFSLVLRLARQITGRHDVDDVLAETFRCLRPLMAFGGGSIQLLDDEGWIQMAAADPPAPAHVLAHRVPLGTSVAGRIVLTEQPVYLPDLLAEAPTKQHKAVSGGVRSYFGAPLVADGAAIGVLQVDSPEPNAWTEQEREIFLAVAPIVAAAIQNARSHARAASARTQSAAAGDRLHEARQLLVELRAARARHDEREFDELFCRLEAVIGDVPAVLRRGVRVPHQRLVVR
jgi:GAF domain-containing protein